MILWGIGALILVGLLGVLISLQVTGGIAFNRRYDFLGSFILVSVFLLVALAKTGEAYYRWKDARAALDAEAHASEKAQGEAP